MLVICVAKDMQKKLKGRRRRRGLARDEDIREYVQPFIDRLFELYEVGGGVNLE